MRGIQMLALREVIRYLFAASANIFEAGTKNGGGIKQTAN